jgi:predicted MFS family arabinose efflux permease
MMAFVSFGAGEVLGGLITGQIVDRLGGKTTTVVNMFLIFITTLILICWLYEFEFNWLTFLTTFMWGF